MRIETTVDYSWRTDLYDRAGDALGENTRSGAIDGACESPARCFQRSPKPSSTRM